MSFDPLTRDRQTRIRAAGSDAFTEFLAARQTKTPKPLDELVPHHPILGGGEGDESPNSPHDEGDYGDASISAAVADLLPKHNIKIVDVWPAAYSAPRLIKPKKLLTAAEPDPNPPPSPQFLAEQIRGQGPLLVSSPTKGGDQDEVLVSRWSLLSQEEKETLLRGKMA
jgi:hypothetical protein